MSFSVFFYAYLAPKEYLYGYKSRTVFILYRYKNKCFVLEWKPQQTHSEMTRFE